MIGPQYLEEARMSDDTEFEVIVIPVSEVDRAKGFHGGLTAGTQWPT